MEHLARSDQYLKAERYEDMTSWAFFKVSVQAQTAASAVARLAFRHGNFTFDRLCKHINDAAVIR